MKDPSKIINALSPADALQVLKALAQEDAEMAVRIAKLADRLLKQVNFEEIAERLVSALEGLEVEEVWDRARKTRHGYVEPGEAAGQMIEEALAPFLDEMKKYQRMEMNKQAQQMCMGLLLGLYDFEYISTSEFKNWAPDATLAFAMEVWDIWKAGSPSKASLSAMRNFFADYMGSWLEF